MRGRGDGRRHEVIAETLRDLIRAGDYPVGALLPSTNELCTQFHTSPTTVRRAVELLAHEGVANAVHGAGTFVTAVPPAKGLSVEEELAAIAADLGTLHHRVEHLRDHITNPNPNHDDPRDH